MGFFKTNQRAGASSAYCATSQLDKKEEASQASQGASLYALEMGIGLIVKSPDHLADILRTAKIKELEQYPLTSQLSFKGETVVTIPEEPIADYFNSFWR